MAKQPQSSTAGGVQPIKLSPDLTPHQSPDLKADKTTAKHVKSLVRRLTTKVRPSKTKDASLPAGQETAEDKLAGFMSRNPALYRPADDELKRPNLEIPEPVARPRQLSRSQRAMERLETPLILDPTPPAELEEQEKAKETMRQSRTARFRNRLEEYF
ncbi:hypothetical protein BDR22DRAFT_906195 [Usnea florida]